MVDKRLQKVINEINAQKLIIANARDKVSELYYELEDLLDSFDRGVEGFDRALEELRDAIDSISEQV